MNLRQIEIFRAIMLAGSVTDAARLLHVSQPGISRMLGHIELQLGVRLFERSRGRLQPTPEARTLYREVDKVWRGVQRIDDCARELRTGGGLTLRVLASPSMGLEIVPQAVSGLAAQFTQARIYMEVQLLREMVPLLVREEADLAICSLPVDHAPLAAEAVGSWTLSCVFQAGHRFESRRSLSMRDLMQERLIAFSPDTPQGRLIAQWSGEPDPAGAQGRLEVRSGQVACALAACGAGVAVVDNLTARAWRSDQLRFRPISKAPVFQAYAVRNPAAPASLLEEGFIERVRAGFARLRRGAED